MSLIIVASTPLFLSSLSYVLSLQNLGIKSQKTKKDNFLMILCNVILVSTFDYVQS